MAYVPKGANKALLKRVQKVLDGLQNGGRPRYGPEDESVLEYVRDELKKTDEADPDCSRLHMVAEERLVPYEGDRS